MPDILYTYGDVSAKEDVVLNAIEILTAQETQIFNMLGKTEAINTIHAYLTDTLQTAASSAVAEEGDYSNKTLTTPSRLTNLVQITAIPFKVTRTQRDIQHYHGEDELTRQTNKALKDWANSAEFDLVRSTAVSGVSGTAPKCSGIIEATSKSTNHTTHTSTTQWSATILNGMMKNNYDNSNGDLATDIFLSSAMRAATDAFTTKTNQIISAPGVRQIVNTVSTYETAFGTVNFHTHRYIYVSGTDTYDRVLAIRPEKLKVAFLKKPYIDTDLARSGDYDVRAVVGKFTLEVRNQDSNWFADALVA